jgi:hypothetical protein
MIRHVPRFFYLTLSLLAIGLAGAKPQTTASSPGTPTISDAPMYNPGPITPYNAAAKPYNGALRFRRGERYNSPNSTLPELGKDSAATSLVEGFDFQPNPMPFDQSEVVVVGLIKSGQAHLSNDKRDIYSEFDLSVQEVIKNQKFPYLQTGETIAVERHGGAVQLPSGKVLIRGAKDYSMPLVGKRYLLFLNYYDSTEDYHIRTGYQLEGSHVYALDDVNRHEEGLVRPLREIGSSETVLLDRARTVVQGKKAR